MAVKNETKNTKPLTTACLVVLWSSMPGVSSGVKFSETFFPFLPKENSNAREIKSEIMRGERKRKEKKNYHGKEDTKIKKQQNNKKVKREKKEIKIATTRN